MRPLYCLQILALSLIAVLISACAPTSLTTTSTPSSLTTDAVMTATNTTEVVVPGSWGTGFDDPCVQRFFLDPSVPDLVSLPEVINDTGCQPVDTSKKRVISTALRWIGAPYSWGGGDLEGPTLGLEHDAANVGFDCSAFVRYAWSFGGTILPRTAQQQWEGPYLHVNPDQSLLPGDLLYFASDPSDASSVYHVALYLGDGNIIEAAYDGGGVRVLSDALGYEVYARDFIGAVRLGS